MAKRKHFDKQVIYSGSQTMCFKLIFYMFIFYEFYIFLKFQKWSDFRLCHQNRSQNREIKIFS